MKNRIILIALTALLASCAVTKNETTISPYNAAKPAIGQSALVYALPQTRLFFEVELVKKLVKKGPYAEYAGRMLYLQNVPLKDAESWQIRSIRIRNRQEVDNRQLYAVSFIDYPQNIDRLLRFSREGLLLDVTVSNVVVGSQNTGKSGDEFQFVNTAVSSTVVEKADTLYKTVLTDTAFIRIPVLQRKVTSKSLEEMARETAQQIFDIRKDRYKLLVGDVDYKPDNTALKEVLRALDTQEAQLLSLFTGVTLESRQTVRYSVLPDKAATTGALFSFSDRAGVVAKNTAGAKEVWYEIGKAAAPSTTPEQQAKNIIYYRIPQTVEVSAGVDKTAIVSEQVSICQFGNIVSFPLIAPEK